MKNIPKKITVYNAAREPVFTGALRDLPLREDVIIAKSIEFFSDPNPCFIHKGAVMTRLYEEIEQYIASTGSAEVFIGDFPERLLKYLEV